MNNLAKRTIYVSLSTIAVLGALPMAGQAAEVIQTVNTSKADVTLEAGDTTTPVDPILPSIPDGSTGNTGMLTLDNITPFQFDKHKVTGGTETYSITATGANVQVSDRRGTGAGWELKVTAATFKDKVDNTKVLKGAQIVIPKGEVQSTVGNTSEKPTTNLVTLDALDGEISSVLFQAEKDQGMGTWVDQLNPSEVKIIIPGGNFVGEYSSTLTWVLGDTPKG